MEGALQDGTRFPTVLLMIN